MMAESSEKVHRLHDLSARKSRHTISRDPDGPPTTLGELLALHIDSQLAMIAAASSGNASSFLTRTPGCSERLHTDRTRLHMGYRAAICSTFFESNHSVSKSLCPIPTRLSILWRARPRTCTCKRSPPAPCVRKT